MESTEVRQSQSPRKRKQEDDEVEAQLSEIATSLGRELAKAALELAKVAAGSGMKAARAIDEQEASFDADGIVPHSGSPRRGELAGNRSTARATLLEDVEAQAAKTASSLKVLQGELVQRFKAETPRSQLCFPSLALPEEDLPQPLEGVQPPALPDSPGENRPPSRGLDFSAPPPAHCPDDLQELKHVRPSSRPSQSELLQRLGGREVLESCLQRSQRVAAELERRSRNSGHPGPPQHDQILRHMSLQELLGSARNQAKPALDKLCQALVQRQAVRGLKCHPEEVMTISDALMRCQVRLNNNPLSLCDIIGATLSLPFARGLPSLYDLLELLLDAPELDGSGFRVVAFDDGFQRSEPVVQMLLWARIRGFIVQLRLTFEEMVDLVRYKVVEDVDDVLLYAAMCNDLRLLQQSLSRGASPSQARTSSGFSALHYAAQNDNREMVDTLLEKGASPLALDGSGLLPLYRCVMLGNREVLPSLLQATEAALRASSKLSTSSLPSASPREPNGLKRMELGQLAMMSQAALSSESTQPADKEQLAVLRLVVAILKLQLIEEGLAQDTEGGLWSLWAQERCVAAWKKARMHPEILEIVGRPPQGLLEKVLQGGSKALLDEILSSNGWRFSKQVFKEDVPWLARFLPEDPMVQSRSQQQQQQKQNEVPTLITPPKVPTTDPPSRLRPAPARARLAGLPPWEEALAAPATRGAPPGLAEASASRPHTSTPRHEVLPEAAEGEGSSLPLLEAIREGDAARAQELLESSDPDQQDGKGVTALMLACAKGNAPIVTALLNKSAMVESQASDGGFALVAACKGGHREVADLLLQRNAVVNRADSAGISPLLAASQGGYEELVSLLLAQRAEVNKADRGGRSALMWASYAGSERAASELLAKGAHVNWTCNEGFTSLALASQYGHRDLVQMLIMKQAEVERTNLALQTPLMLASSFGHPEVVQTLLENMASLTKKDQAGCQALALACAAGQRNTVELLIEKQAPVNVRDNLGWSPLMSACSQGHLDVLELLLDKEALVNVPDLYWTTPLMQACKRGHCDVVQHLVQREAAVDVKDKFGNTPLTIALQHKHLPIVEFLVKKSAKSETMRLLPLILALRDSAKGASGERTPRDRR